mmetsp:Transcript_44914/g.72282  ORF Transcript_44914/g.72282 Transcript_44914/m.72282 type:complete len:231 (+) Transcript_44914:3-695(+)
MMEAKLLGVEHSDLVAHEGSKHGLTSHDLQRLVQASSLIGTPSRSEGQLAIAFMTDFMPNCRDRDGYTHTHIESRKGGGDEATVTCNTYHVSLSTTASPMQHTSVNQTITSIDLSHNISRELSLSPQALPNTCVSWGKWISDRDMAKKGNPAGDVSSPALAIHRTVTVGSKYANTSLPPGNGSIGVGELTCKMSGTNKGEGGVHMAVMAAEREVSPTVDSNPRVPLFSYH